MQTVLTLVLLTLYASYSLSLANFTASLSSSLPQLTISGTATNVVELQVNMIPDNSSNKVVDTSLKSTYISVDILTAELTYTFTSINKTLPAFIKSSERDIRLVLVYIECSITVIQYTIDTVINSIFVVQKQILRIPCVILRILITIINMKINLLLQLISNLQQALHYAVFIGFPFIYLLQQALRLALQRLIEAIRLAIYYWLLLRRYCVYYIYFYQIDSYVISLQNNLENALVLQIQTLVNSAAENDYLSPEDDYVLTNATQELAIVINGQLSVAQNSSDKKSTLDSIKPQFTAIRAQLQASYNTIIKIPSFTPLPTFPNPPEPDLPGWPKIIQLLSATIDLIDTSGGVTSS